MRPVFTLILFISLVVLLSGAIAFDCPFCSGGFKKFCDIGIPEDRFYNKELVINITEVYAGDAIPVKEGTDVEISFYNAFGEIETVDLETDSNGIVKYTPKTVGHYLVKSNGEALLIYVNTTCGDGVCGGSEDRRSCTQDCGNCGDGVCDSNEDASCKDCSVCGDKKCTTGESRDTCLRDCLICGDAICDYLENRKSCSLDCASGLPDGSCDGENDSVCDPDCNDSEDADCLPEPYLQMVQPAKPKPTQRSSGSNDALLIAISIAALIVIAAFVFWKKRRSCHKSGEEKKNSENKDKASHKDTKTKKDKKKAVKKPKPQAEKPDSAPPSPALSESATVSASSSPSQEESK